MIDRNPYAIEAPRATSEFTDVWAGAYDSADEQLRAVWARLRDAWLRSKQKAGSAHTRRAYEKASADWMTFVSGIRTNGRPLQLWEVTSDHVRLWQSELGQTLAASSVNQRLSICSSWYTFVINERGMVNGFEVSAFMDRSGRTRSNPFNSFTVPRDREDKWRSARVLKLSEIRSLLEYLDEAKNTLFGSRNRALMLAYLLTGYRNREVVTLRAGDIRPHKSVPGQWVVRWRGKGNKARMDPMPVRVVDAINDYFAVARRYPSPEEYIFVPLRTAQLANVGITYDGGHLSCDQVRRVLKTCARRAGIEDWRRIRVHDLRHTFAHRFRAQNPDLEALRERLHHESLATTGIYAQTFLVEPVDNWSEGFFEK